LAPGVPSIEMNGSAELGKLMLHGFVENETISPNIQTAVASMPTKDFFWQSMPDGSGGTIANDTRHAFAMSTCNGCHAAETGTTFMHIKPRAWNERAELSDFLKSSKQAPLRIDDPSQKDPHKKNEYQEQQRRADKFTELLCW